MIGRYRSKVQELESGRMKDSSRLAELQQDLKIYQSKLEVREDELKNARHRVTAVEADLALTKGSLYEIEEQSISTNPKQSNPTKSIGLKAAAAVATSTAFIKDEVEPLINDEAPVITTHKEADDYTQKKESTLDRSTDVNEANDILENKTDISSKEDITHDQNQFIDSKALNNEFEAEVNETKDIDTNSQGLQDQVEPQSTYEETTKLNDGLDSNDSESSNILSDRLASQESSETIDIPGADEAPSSLSDSLFGQELSEPKDIVNADETPSTSEDSLTGQESSEPEDIVSANETASTLRDRVIGQESLESKDTNLADDKSISNTERLEIIESASDTSFESEGTYPIATPNEDLIDPSSSSVEDSNIPENIGLTAAAAAIGAGSVLSGDKDKHIQENKKGNDSIKKPKDSIEEKLKVDKKSNKTKSPKRRNTYVESGFKRPASGRFQNVIENDLSAVEGVGPKTAEVLQKNGVKSWSDLSMKTPLEIKEILSKSGSRFSHIDPSSWPRQAKLASGNHWTRLEKLQDEMDGGKTIKAKNKTNSKGTKPKATTAKAKSKTKTKPEKDKAKSAAKSKSQGTSKKRKSIESTTKSSVNTASKASKKTKKTKASIEKSQSKKKTKPKTKKTSNKTKPTSATTSKSNKKKSKNSKNPKIVVGRAIKSSNLQVIEGLGPKMNSLLIKEGISSWSKLAKYSPAQLRSKLEKHGDRYRIIDVKTWPKQATYAAKGQWNKLIQFQQKDGSESKAEKLLQKAGVFNRYKKNDLKVIEGIGPKIEELLHNAGIKTWPALSKTSKSKLSGILNKAGKRYGLADPSSWPKQAGLAAAGKFEKLEALQKKL